MLLTAAQEMRATAANYRRLAEHQADAKEREKYLAYARVYDELAMSRKRAQLYERPSAPEKVD
jgi:hypothetical protein